MEANVGAASHHGLNVPVAESAPGIASHGDRAAVAPNDNSRLDGVHGGSVTCGDVDAEVERRQGPFHIQMETGIAEAPADRMRLVERLDRPAVGAGRGRKQEREERREDHRAHAHLRSRYPTGRSLRCAGPRGHRRHPRVAGSAACAGFVGA